MNSVSRTTPGFRAASIVAACAAAWLAPGRSFAQSASPVQWTNLVNATASGAAVQKTGGCGGCADAGATSSASIAGGDGYAEFTPGSGARLYVGLAENATAITDPALVDFGFSFWPDGGWDVRERNVYRTEGRFAAGDVFRVAIENGVVTYSRNGAAVYTSAVPPAWPLVLNTVLVDAGATVTTASMSTASTSGGSGTVSSTYDAITDRAVRPKGAPTALGAAGFTFTDPLFGSRILRVTDGNTRPGLLDRSYRTPSGTHTNAWSADGRLFYTVSTDGTIIPFAFDAATMTAQRLQPSNAGDGGLTLRFFNEPTFSYLTAGVVYGTYNGSGTNLHSVDQYDFQSGQYTQLLDLETLVASLAGTYVGGLGASAGTTERIIAFFGGTGQDQHYLLVVFDRSNPGSRHLVDTIASTVDGQPTNTLLNFRIHAAAIDRSGRYVTIYPTGADTQAPRSAAPAYVWDILANSFTATPLVDARSGGHDAYGYGYRVNQDCCTRTTWDAAQWQIRSLATPLITADLIAPVLSPKEVYLADHPSWHNAQSDRLVPFIDATYRYGTNTTDWRAWDEEIIAVQTDTSASGSIVWRFAHHHSNVGNDGDPTRIYFWYTPRVNVSPDGRWALFTSNWEKTLGTDPRGEVGGAYRQDLFLIELKNSGVAGAPPVAIGTSSLPAGTVSQPYSATLQATGGSGVYTWNVVAGALPAGLALDASTGVIAGTPQMSGTASFTVRVSDAADPANLADQNLAISVAPAPAPPLSITTTSLPNAMKGTRYSCTLQATGGLLPLRWTLSSGALPAGLALDATTGTISGTPLSTGTWSFTVKVTDSATPAATAMKSLSLRVRRK